jgi:hypothetical protein
MTSPGHTPDTPTGSQPSRGSWVAVAVAWFFVAIPIAWGVYRTLRSAVALFR